MHADPAQLQPGEAVVIENVEARFAPTPWLARWHRREGGAPTSEDGPGWDSLDEALVWAAARAPTIRFVTQEAGMEPDLEALSRSVDIELAEAQRRVPAYGGTVVVVNVQPWLIASGSFTAYRTGDQYPERDVFTDVDAAIDWARHVAGVVVVSLGSTGRDLFSAGRVDPPGESLPRLRARNNAVCVWAATATADSSTLGLAELNVVVDEVLARPEFSAVEVRAREEDAPGTARAHVTLRIRLRNARYGEAKRLAESFNVTLGGAVARRERPDQNPLLYIVLESQPMITFVAAPD